MFYTIQLRIYLMKLFTETRSINLLLVIGIAIVGACNLFSHKQAQQMDLAHSWVVHTYKVINTANATLISLTDAESRLNFYVLTDDKAVIEKIPRLTRVALDNAQLLEQLTSDNIIENTRAKELTSLANQKITLMQQIIQMGNAASQKIMTQLSTSQKRLSLKNDITRVVAEINQEEINLLIMRNQKASQEINVSNVLLIIFGFLSEFFLILSLLFINYNFKKRQQAEKEILAINKNLKESEERYLLATEGSSSGLWDWSVGTDRIYYSPHFKKLLGYSDEEFPDSLESFEKVIHPHDHDPLWEKVKEHLEQHLPFETNYRLRKKTGEYNWYQVVGQAVWDESGLATRMLGYIIDIEDRKRAEQSLNIQHNIAEIISEATSIEEIAKDIIKIICEELRWNFGAIWKVDHDLKVLKCVETWYQNLNRLKEFNAETRSMQLSYGVGLLGQVYEKKTPMWFLDIGKNADFSRSKVANETGLTTAFAFPVIAKNNVVGIIECYSGEKELPDKHILDLMETIGTQIGQFIERKTAEKKLRESESYKAAILTAASDCIITVNHHHKIQSFNTQTTKEFGFSSKELISKNIEKIIPKFDVNVAQDPGKTEIEMLAVRKNKEEFPVEIKVSTMPMGEHDLSVIIVRNITERKKVEKMKNEFLSVVSHELRTPLTSIRGALGLVGGGALGDVPEKMKNILDLANNNCQRLLLLINDILDIEKLEAGKMEFKIFDLVELVKDTITANKIYADKFNVKLVLTESLERVEINADPNRLAQVLTNLISNAVKFSPEKEEVTITIKKQGDTVRVLLSNKGPGIPLDFQPRIFEKFSQADASNTRGKGGTGLGLSISKAIIDKLGGTINFVSKPNEITTFYFDLPLWHPVGNIVEDEIKKASPEKLLICEDDEDQANYLSKLLESAGYQADVAYNVQEAKKLLANQTYHALLLDLILPDQDGISFIREIRSDEKIRELPIIVLSIIAQTGHQLMGDDTYLVRDWLEKPIDFDKLLHAISNIKTTTHPELPIVLHVEDDQLTSLFVKDLLAGEAEVVSAASIEQTVEKLKYRKFDLVVLDLLLPDGNSEKIIPLIKSYNVPIIVYSAMELDKDLTKVVEHILLKSDTSNEKLLHLIKLILEQKK